MSTILLTLRANLPGYRMVLMLRLTTIVDNLVDPALASGRETGRTDERIHWPTPGNKRPRRRLRVAGRRGHRPGLVARGTGDSAVPELRRARRVREGLARGQEPARGQGDQARGSGPGRGGARRVDRVPRCRGLSAARV